MGNLDIVNRLLVHEDIDVTLVNIRGHTLLHVIAIHGSKQVCQILLPHLGNLDARDHSGRTALYLACQYNNFEIVKLM